VVIHKKTFDRLAAFYPNKSHLITATEQTHNLCQILVDWKT